MTGKPFSSNEEAFKMLIRAAEYLGWCSCLMPPVEDDEPVPGITLGTEEYVNEIMERLEDD